MKGKGEHIHKRDTIVTYPVVVPYVLIKMIIDIAIGQDKHILKRLTSVNSNWRHATLFHRFRLFKTVEWIQYLRWIKESGIQFDISVYVKDVQYVYPSDMLTCFETLNLDSLTIYPPPSSFINYYSDYRKFLTFVQSINSVKI